MHVPGHPHSLRERLRRQLIASFFVSFAVTPQEWWFLDSHYWMLPFTFEERKRNAGRVDFAGGRGRLWGNARRDT